MEIKKKNAFLILIGILSITNIICFVLYYVSSFLTSSTVLIYAYVYFSEIAMIHLPLICAAFTLTVYAKQGINKALLYAIPCSLCAFFYTFPYRAFEFAYEGYEITATLLLALLETLLTVIVNYIEITVLLLLIIFVTKIIAKSKGIPNFNFNTALSEKETFDFDKPLTAGIFSAACAVFVYSLIIEIIDTVSFLINYSGTYRTGEILYILFRYVFILGMLIISHILTHYAKRKMA